jgi:plasmid maintenance system antidote protein VapI
MRELLRQRVEAAGSQTAAAKILGVSPQYLHDCLRGRREIGKSIAIPLGYEPLTIYVPHRGVR